MSAALDRARQKLYSQAEVDQLLENLYSQAEVDQLLENLSYNDLNDKPTITNGVTPVKGIDYFDGVTPVQTIVEYYGGLKSTIDEDDIALSSGNGLESGEFTIFFEDHNLHTNIQVHNLAGRTCSNTVPYGDSDYYVKYTSGIFSAHKRNRLSDAETAINMLTLNHISF